MFGVEGLGFKVGDLVTGASRFTSHGTWRMSHVTPHLDVMLIYVIECRIVIEL